VTVSGGRAGGWTANSSGVRNSPAPATDHLVALSRIGENFEITGSHAEGATCEVFKGHHVALDIAIAIKVLKPEYAADSSFLERMRIEAQVLPRLRSRHIVRCFDRGFTDDGRPFTVLEFLRGEPLEALLSKLRTFDELMAIDLGLELLEALATTHAQGVVHRDVSPHNLIVHRTELEPTTLKLIDFGFAWIMPNAPESAPEPSSKREHGVAVGTPRYASPEVAMGRTDIDGRSDLYSAGVILYTMLAGRDPFAELRTPEAVLDAHANRAVPPIARYAPRVSPELTSFVMRLLEKDRANRFPSASEAAAALREARHATQQRTRQRLSTPPPSHRPALRTRQLRSDRSGRIDSSETLVWPAGYSKGKTKPG
jgi:serine/threonine protein kinase